MSTYITASRASRPLAICLNAMWHGKTISYSRKTRQLRIGSTTVAGLSDADLADLDYPYGDLAAALRIVADAQAGCGC
ncbi:MAG: hypothetical protein J0M00_06685 [Burkholderiales bacterium]|nr:hypothetical protein [Burkholderiales bacterium]